MQSTGWRIESASGDSGTWPGRSRECYEGGWTVRLHRSAYTELSGGQRRRVAILRGLLADYDFLILDEPFRGLDRETKRLVMEDTRRRCMERTVLLVTHDAAELEVLGVTELLTGLK